MTEIAYIGFGSNLGNSMALLALVSAEMNACDGLVLKRTSPVYQSSPIDVPDVQNDYINAVFEVETLLEPMAILKELLRIEDAFGRVRGKMKNSARTLDLDLLLVGNNSIRNEVLSLPHPQMHKRAFVLYPLSDLSPELEIPGQGKVENLLKNVNEQKIVRL